MDWPNPRTQHWNLDSNTDCTLQVNDFTSIWVSPSFLLSESVDPLHSSLAASGHFSQGEFLPSRGLADIPSSSQPGKLLR